MSNNIYLKKILKLYYFFKNPLYKVYCFIFRPKSLGVKIIVENNGKLLMTKLGYAHKKWVFPGGAVNKKENAEQTAVRELEEETGIKTNKLIEIGEYTSERNYKKNIVKCFYLLADSSFVKIDNFEVIDSGWYNPQELPKDCSVSIPQIIKIYQQYKLKQN
ncbi:NUDIX hydrolase [Patescibacteria group bacterium]|nr:NUDIX hydrolase [Patescibacteria group bacterium]